MRSNSRYISKSSGRASEHQVAIAGAASELNTFARLLRWLPVWALLALTIAALIVAYQTAHIYRVDVGAPQDEAYVRNFHSRVSDPAPSYRWSDVYGYVAFPGLGGSRPFTVTVQLDPGRTAPVIIIVNGVTLFSKTLQPGWRDIVLAVNATNSTALASRDTVVEFRAPDYRTPDAPAELKGVKVASVSVEQAPSGAFIVPAYATLAWSGASLLLLYLFVGRSLAGFAIWGRARLWGLLVALVAAVYLVAQLAASHVVASSDVEHIAITTASAIIMLVVAERVLARWWTGVGRASRRVLAFCFALAFVLRYGGMALPQSVIIDMPWHMKWLNTLLAGNWQALYFPGGLSSVPSEWGVQILIPKSPLFYFAFAPLSLLPFDLATLVKWLICLMDASVVLGVFWLALRLGAAGWAGVLAAALYALMPLAFRAFAYGILPTIFAQWLAMGVLVYALALGDRRWKPIHWVAFPLLLALALLAFPTVALFLSLALVAAPAIWWLSGRRAGGPRPFQWRLILSLGLAWGLAVLAYYGLYISLELTSVGVLLAPGAGSGSTVRWPGGWPELLAWTADYIVTALPMLLAALGMAWIFTRKRAFSSRAVWLIVIWLAVGPIFFVANYRVDMIGKHLFFIMAPVAVLGGVALWQVARRGRWAMALMSLALATVGWQALVFWIDRLVRASS